MKISKLLLTLLAFAAGASCLACTSAIISPRVTANHRPMIWKHRDTGTEHNFVERVDRPGQIGYIALFNGGDSLLAEAWMGMNDAGFAIMNTASYNLAPDTARVKDREGLVMARALATCRTLDDFMTLLDTLPRPMGIQANFGVMDLDGNMAYVEADDNTARLFAMADTADVLIRTNHSLSGTHPGGMGYIRYENARQLLEGEAQNGYKAQTFTETLSRTYWHSLLGRDCDGDRWVVDQDFIPRYSSSASIVIEGGDTPGDYVMWTVLGYPPVGEVIPATLKQVPDDLRPVAAGWRAPANNAALQRKRRAFPITRGNGKHYIDMEYVRPVRDDMHRRSMATYKAHGR